MIAVKEGKASKRQKVLEDSGEVEARLATQQRCSNYGKTGHNVRTCQEVEETSDEGSYIESN